MVVHACNPISLRDQSLVPGYSVQSDPGEEGWGGEEIMKKDAETTFI